MDDLLSGLVDSVTSVPVGTQTIADAAVGDTVLLLEDAGDMSPTGGQVAQIADDGSTVAVLDYVESDDDESTITLAAPLTTALPTDTVLRVYPERRNVTALVLVNGTSEPIPANVPWDKQDALPVGPRDASAREEVTLEPTGQWSWAVYNLDGQPLVRDASYLDPDTIPEATPVAPTVSPAVTVTGMPTALLIHAEQIATGHVIQYHIATDATLRDTAPNDPATASGLPTRSPIYLATTLPNGADFAKDTDYTVWAVASHPAIPGSEAPPSPAVTAQLDLTAIESVIVATVVAGIVMAGRFESGLGYWDPDEGIVLPQPDGTVTRLSTDGVTPSTLAGFILASAGITVQGNANFYGATQMAGDLRLADGVTDPTQKIGVSRTWTRQRRYSFAAPNPTITDSSVGGKIVGLTVRPDGTKLVSAYTYGGFGINLVSTDIATAYGSTQIDGVQTPAGDAVTSFYPWGITTLGAYHYVIGWDASRNSAKYVYKVDATTRVKVAEFPVAAANMPNNAVIGTDGTNLLVSWVNPTGILWLRTYTPAGVQIGSDVNLMTAATGSLLGGIYRGTADFGADRLVIAFEGSDALAFNPASSYARVTAHDFPRAASAKVQGFCWDGAAFKSSDNNGYLRYYETGVPTATTVYAGQTWYDGDTGGTGVHETKVSPAASFSRPARSRLVLDAKPAPDAGVTDPAALDKANLIRIYVGTSAAAMRLQSSTGPNGALPVGQTHLEVGALDTGSAIAPTVSTFAGAAGGVGRAFATSGGFTIDGASNGSIGTGSFRDSVDARIDKRHQGGTVTVSTFAGTGSANAQTVDVVFAQPFNASPNVRVGVHNDPSAFTMWPSNVTTTGFTLNVYRNAGTGSLSARWDAFERTQ